MQDAPGHCDAVVVLNTGLEYYPRLIEAASIFKGGWADQVVINGNRKTDVLRELEAQGFQPCCPWYADSLQILTMFGVPKNRIVWISAEDVYDTVTEAEAVGKELLDRNIRTIVVTTSKFHSRRANAIWKDMYEDDLTVYVVPAESDPYDPQSWWKDGRQIRWVLAEYGAWVYYWWKSLTQD